MSQMKFVFQGNDAEDVIDGAKIFLQQHGVSCDEHEKAENVFTVLACKAQKATLRVCKHGCECEITYVEKTHFFRGLSLLLENINREHFCSEEPAHFSSNGAMLDCARNGVPTVETLKKYIVYLAQFGMNRLYLYLEDLLELKDYPHWGYLRGRYTKAEMQEVDGYAQKFGVVLVPCLQTLAHLHNVLKQPAFAGYKDIDDILLLEDEKTYKLLRALLTTVSECFSGGIVHLGMDEAANLGRGKYMDRHGTVPPAQIMQKHLTWLLSVCEELSLQPMIWSDMYLKFNFQTQDYYGLAEDATPKNSGTLSKNVGLCYWDYYNEGQPFYEKYLRLHQKLGNPLVFSGAAWTWNGVAPNISKAIRVTQDSLDACIATGVKDIFFTVWMDNGAETPLDTCLPTLAWYGEYGFGAAPTEECVKRRFEGCFHKSYEAFMLLDAFDNIEHGKKHNRWCVNPSKTVLYEDCLMALYAASVEEKAYKSHYARLCKKLQAYVKEQGDNTEETQLFTYYLALAKVLYQKAGIFDALQESYRNGDKEKLKKLAKTLSCIVSETKVLREYREDIWMAEYKPFGFEMLDIRLAGVAQRAQTASKRILAYLAGKQKNIPELEEAILPVRTNEQLEKDVLHGYYFWDDIASIGSIRAI